MSRERVRLPVRPGRLHASEGGSYAMKLAVWGQASPLLTKRDETLGSGHLKGPSDRLQLLFPSPPPRGRRLDFVPRSPHLTCRLLQQHRRLRL